MRVPVFVRIGKHAVNLDQIAEILCEPAPLGPQGELILAAFIRLTCGREIVVTGSEAVQMQRLADQLAVDHDDLRPNDTYATGDGFVPTQADIGRLSGAEPWGEDVPL